MQQRALYLTLALSCSACSFSSPPGAKAASSGQVCLAQAEDWLRNPLDKNKLKKALQTVKEANEDLKKTASKEDGVLLTDLDLLQGALNMAKMQFEQGRGPNQPTEFSESTPIDGVTVATEQLRTDLTKQKSGPPSH